MASFLRSAASTELALSRAPAHALSSYGRAPAYKRLASHLSQAQASRHGGACFSQTLAPTIINSSLRSPLLPSELRTTFISASQIRRFHLTQPALQETKPKADASASNVGETDSAEQKKSAEESEPKKESEESQKPEDGEKDDKSAGKEKKEDLPPPPPHGDKTPWQVFMETMNTEFEKSKEWNESTKQIGAAAHQFSESESVRRAREAYEKSTGAISSTASHAVKSTANVIGKGAAWTWETPVVKGVRKVAGVTGEAVDKATKPIRDTEAYKNVKKVIDDGSSSRYGGWVEKEERRKRRELREKELGIDGAKVMQEDPK